MSLRTDKIADLLQREISEIVQYKVKNPKVGFATITAVRVTKDIQYADIYFTVLGSKSDLNETLEGLEHSAKFIRSELAKRIHLRRVPELRFHYDTSLEHANRIEALLQSIKGEN